MRPSTVQVIAHRGASAAAPENTPAAFRLARELGADWVELDARRTADDRIVVHHDPLLPDGRTLVSLSADQAAAAGVCSLTEALDACAGMSVNVEIKNLPGEPDFDPTERVAAAVVAAIDGRDARATTLVSCFHRPTLDRVRALDPALPTALLFFALDEPVADLAASVAADGHVALHPWDGLVDSTLVSVAHDQGLLVNVWTVDDPARMRTLVELGVDGVCSNVPDVARAVVDGFGETTGSRDERSPSDLADDEG